jgi:hypothetical protein
MSRRRAAIRAFGGILIIPAGLTGILLMSSATPAPAATNPCAAKLTAVVVSSASATPTPTASASSSASGSAAASATPTPTASASSSAAATPSPTPTTTSPSPTPTATSTSPSPSPSSSSTSPSASDQLCITVQPLAANVKEGGQARYAIWVWLAGKVNGSAKIKIAAKPGQPAPSFTVCAAPGGTTCSVDLTAAQAVQLRAAVAVPQDAVAGTHITLTATGASAQSTAPASGSGSVTVTAAATPATTPATDPLGVGVTLPGGLPPGELSSAGLPQLPGAVTDPSAAFPQVTPTPDPTPAPIPIHVSDVSASFPLSTRLVGGQIVGLAVLAAAVTIAVARLSLRRQRPPDSQDPS